MKIIKQCGNSRNGEKRVVPIVPGEAPKRNYFGPILYYLLLLLLMLLKKKE